MAGYLEGQEGDGGEVIENENAGKNSGSPPRPRAASDAPPGLPLSTYRRWVDVWAEEQALATQK
jgi:hypothetical protein